MSILTDFMNNIKFEVQTPKNEYEIFQPVNETDYTCEKNKSPMTSLFVNNQNNPVIISFPDTLYNKSYSLQQMGLIGDNFIVNRSSTTNDFSSANSIFMDTSFNNQYIVIPNNVQISTPVKKTVTVKPSTAVSPTPPQPMKQHQAEFISMNDIHDNNFIKIHQLASNGGHTLAPNINKLISISNVKNAIGQKNVVSETATNGINKTSKSVKFINHEFVISDTEQIPVDVLLSANLASVKQKSQIHQKKPKNVTETFEFASKNGTNALKNKPKRFLKSSLIEIKRKNGEKTPCYSQKVNEPKDVSIGKNDFLNTKMYFVKNNDLKPILSSNIANSGVFRPTPTTDDTIHSKRKRSETDDNEPQNIVISKSEIRGGIMTKDEYKKELNKMQSVSFDSGNFNTSTTNGGVVPKRTYVFVKSADLKNGQILPQSIVAAVENSDNGQGGENDITATSFPVQISHTSSGNESTQTLDDEQIKHIAGAILKTPNNASVSMLSDRKTVVYHNPETNAKIIYRVINPEDVNLRKDETPNQTTEKSYIPILPKPQIVKNRPGRRKGVLNKKKEEPSISDPVPTARTRSGRVSRPPRHIQKYYKSLNIIDSSDNGLGGKREENFDDVLQDPLNGVDETILEKVNTKPKRARCWPAYKCDLCGRVYVSPNKLSRHLATHTELNFNQNSAILNQLPQGNTTAIHNNQTQLGIYEYFIQKLKNVPIENRAQLFIDELAGFLEKVQFLSTKLITENIDCPIKMINENAGHILGISSGHYRMNMMAIEDINIEQNPSNCQSATTTSTAPVTSINTIQMMPMNIRNSDANGPIITNSDTTATIDDDCNLNISLEDSIGEATKMNLSESMMMSDDSLFQSVDDLMREKIKGFTEEELNNPTGHHHHHQFTDSVNDVPSNTKQEQSTPLLDLSMELFQFHNN